MRLGIYLQGMFKNETDLSKNEIIKEIAGMRNSQPPEKPTFIINQKEIKNRLTMKLVDCNSGMGFEHVVLTGKIGGGKTHFLNWIESRLNENGDFYMVKFQVQETNIVKNNFIMMIVSKLFQQYYEDFLEAISNIVEGELEQDQDSMISQFCNKYSISNDLATLLYIIYSKGKHSSAALRVIGASHGRTELSKLKVKSLRDSDYIQVIQFFLNNKLKGGFLLILLDEFEHAYTYLTPAARRNFFVSYKMFIDEVVKFFPAPIALITSVTEQYEGHLKENVNKVEQALWSRMQHQVCSLSEFSPANSSEFRELFNELALRYEIAYGYDVGIGKENDMKKRFLEKMGGYSSQTISYRDAILNMLRIMDDMRMKGETLNDLINSIEAENIKSDFSNNEYERLIEEVKEQWDIAHHNSKPGMLKTAFEHILASLEYRTEKLEQELSSVLFVSNQKSHKLFYIAIAGNIKSLATKLDKCIEYTDSLSNEENNFKTIFMYEKQWESKAIKHMLNLHPDIIPLSLEENELYSLLAYKTAESKNLQNAIILNLERIIHEIR